MSDGKVSERALLAGMFLVFAAIAYKDGPAFVVLLNVLFAMVWAHKAGQSRAS